MVEQYAEGPGAPSHYRSDIDGLRALAVLAVVIFHAFPKLLPGGFIGVDVFFVISGFLITGLLLRDFEAGAFSVRTFYARRIRRIFPALAVVLLTCLAIGWLVLTAEEFSALGFFTSGGAAFLDNILFWRAAGYFDTAADTKPLLHLWSLGIEEQFYLVWPLILWFVMARRWMRPLLLPFMLLLFVASLGFNLWLVGHDPTQAFYSPLSRFWELLLGGLLACRAYSYPDRSSNAADTLRRLAAFPGLLLLALGLVLIHQGRAFPGAWALLPTSGAALVLFSGNASSLNRAVFANRATVALGLISYPLYLWHWPLLSFARILNSERPGASVRVVLVLTSVLLAWLTYRLVERPFRFGARRGWVVPVLSATMIMVFLTGHEVTANDGFQSRNYALLNADPATMVNGGDRSALQDTCGVAPENVALFEWCASDRKPVIPYAVVGDSKGQSLFFGLARETRGDMGWRLLGAVHHLAGDHVLVNEVAYASLANDPATRVVVFANALRGAFSVNADSGFIEGPVSDDDIARKVEIYTSVIQRFERAGKRTVFVMDNPTLPDPNSCVSGGLTRSATLNQFLYRKENRYCRVHYTDHLAGTAPYRVFVERLKQRNPDLLVFDPAPLLCDLRADLCTIAEGRNFLYSYGDHISDYASSKIAHVLLPLIVTMAKKAPSG